MSLTPLSKLPHPAEVGTHANVATRDLGTATREYRTPRGVQADRRQGVADGAAQAGPDVVTRDIGVQTEDEPLTPTS